MEFKAVNSTFLIILNLLKVEIYSLRITVEKLNRTEGSLLWCCSVSRWDAPLLHWNKPLSFIATSVSSRHLLRRFNFTFFFEQQQISFIVFYRNTHSDAWNLWFSTFVLVLLLLTNFLICNVIGTNACCIWSRPFYRCTESKISFTNYFVTH